MPIFFQWTSSVEETFYASFSGVGEWISRYTLAKTFFGIVHIYLQKCGDACHWTEWLTGGFVAQSMLESILFFK